MINGCAACSCLNKMTNATKMVIITFTSLVIFGLLYFILPQILPSNFFILFVMLPMAGLGLLFGLALFGIAFGVNELCERYKRK